MTGRDPISLVHPQRTQAAGNALSNEQKTRKGFFTNGVGVGRSEAMSTIPSTYSGYLTAIYSYSTREIQ